MATRKKTPKSYKIAALQLARPRTSTTFLEEPGLAFAGGKFQCDPKTGIPLYGPRSLGTPRHKQEVHVGFIGTSEAVDHAQQFYEKCSEGVAGDGDHAPFPGCKADRGYRCNLRTDGSLVELISHQERTKILGIKASRQRFEETLQLLQQKMVLLTQKDHPLDYVSVVLPHDLYMKCRTTDYVQKGLGPVHRDLRRAFKAMAMQYQKPTQILLETTTGLASTTRQLDHESVIAWNLFNGLYFKIDGLPWGPTALPPGSCFIGISFFRPLGESSSLRTSVVQAFDENGDGLVLRGHRFPWNEEKDGKSPHLSEQMADQLIEMVLRRYEEERKQLPQRVVVHKTSRFEPAERKGFESALSRVKRFDLVSLHPVSDVRLLRAGRYPPLRGTVFTVGDIAYLYTNGFLPAQGRYPHGHVPCALQVADHVGDTAKAELLREILVLTKMNWNSANMAGLMPITLRFSRLVGDVLREVPADREPQPKYKFYM
jgi:hypothetical protein